jgi:hypothetical protein
MGNEPDPMDDYWDDIAARDAEDLAQYHASSKSDPILKRADYIAIVSIVSRQTDSTWSAEWGSLCARWYLKLRDIPENRGEYVLRVSADEFLNFLVELYPRTSPTDRDELRSAIVRIENQCGMPRKFSVFCKPQGAMGRFMKWLDQP